MSGIVQINSTPSVIKIVKPSGESVSVNPATGANVVIKVPQVTTQDNTSIQKIIVSKDGIQAGIRKQINFIEGDNVTFDIQDDGANQRVNITINATGSGGGAVSSVFGRTGAVVAQAGDYDGFYENPLTFNNGLSRTGNTISGVNAKADSATKGVAAFDASIFTDNGSGLISMNVADANTNGFLLGDDFAIFANKMDTVNFTTGLTLSAFDVTANLSTGIAGGQSVIGGTASGNNLTLSSTVHGTKGKVLFGTSAYDELNNRLGIGTSSPSSGIDITTNALGVTQTLTSGLALVNTTAAAAGAQQISPATRWTGQGWKTNATAGSQAVAFQSFVLPVQGAANPTGTWKLQSSVDGAAFADRMTVDSGGNTFVSGYMQASANMFCNGAMYNSSGVSNGNFWSNSASTGTQTNATGIIFGGGSFTSLRTAFNGQTNYSIPAGNSIGNVVIGAMPLTEASSGTHAIIANLAILAPTITNGAGATTDAATLYINGAPSGITPTSGLYALFVDAGDTRLDGHLGVFGSPATNARLNIGAGSEGFSLIKMGSGAVLTTPDRGVVEFDGTNLFFTPNDTTRRSIFIGKDTGTAPATTATPVFTSYYGTGGTIALSAPNKWSDVVIGGITYKIPLYT
jgi:hypothetical protein